MYCPINVRVESFECFRLLSESQNQALAISVTNRSFSAQGHQEVSTGMTLGALREPSRRLWRNEWREGSE